MDVKCEGVLYLNPFYYFHPGNSHMWNKLLSYTEGRMMLFYYFLYKKVCFPLCFIFNQYLPSLFVEVVIIQITKALSSSRLSCDVWHNHDKYLDDKTQFT